MKCPSCGKELPDNSKFCGNCGATLDGGDRTIASNQPSPGNQQYRPSQPPPGSQPPRPNQPPPGNQPPRPNQPPPGNQPPRPNQPPYTGSQPPPANRPPMGNQPPPGNQQPYGQQQPYAGQQSPLAGVQAAAQAAKSKLPFLKKIPVKLLIIGAAALVVVVAAVIFGVNLLFGGKYLTYKNVLLFTTNDGDVIIMNSSGNKNTLGADVRDYEYSLDARKVAFLTRDDELYFTDGGRPVKVADDVASFVFADSGNGIAYITDVEDNEGTLFVWSGGSSTRVANDVSMSYNYIISPDGKTVAYVGDYEASDDFKMYQWRGGKTDELGNEMVPVLIANNSKYVYYIKRGGDGEVRFQVQRGTNSDTMERLGSATPSIQAVNTDYSQIIYSVEGKTYICVNGRERQGLSGTFSSVIAPHNTQGYGWTVGVKSFANTFYRGYNDSGRYGIYRINGRYESESVVRADGEVRLADDGKTLFYRNNDSIFRVNGRSSNPDPVELVDDDVARLVTVLGNNTFYFINDDGDLYSQRGTGKPTRVQSDSDSWGVSRYGSNRVFYVHDESLYVSSNGRGGERVGANFGGDDVGGVVVQHPFVVVSTDGGEVFVSRNGNSFDRLY